MRNTPLVPKPETVRTWLNKPRKRLAKVSKEKKKRVAVAKERYCDSRGVPFDMYHLQPPIAGKRVADWPAIVRVTNPEVCRVMHQRFDEYKVGPCWQCGEFGPVQAHHLGAGSAGRSDEFTAIVVLCSRCHGQEKESIVPLGRLIYIKWKFDKANLDWVRLALLVGRFLDPLITK